MTGPYAKVFERRFNALVRAGLRPVEAAAWSRGQRPAAILRDVKAWRDLGLEPLEAWEWVQFGVVHFVAAPWVNRGWTFALYREFHYVHGAMVIQHEQGAGRWLGNPETWRDSDIPPHRCISYLRLKFDPHEAVAHERDHTDPDQMLGVLLALNGELEPVRPKGRLG